MATTTRIQLLRQPARVRLASLRRIAAKTHGASWRTVRGGSYDSHTVDRAATGASNRPFESGSTPLTWIENPESIGLRLVGLAHEINRNMRHTGWHTDDDGADECMRGVVYQLPGRDKAPRYVHGYADPWNDGPAALALSRRDWSDDKSDAAYAADSVAEHAAERERDHNRAASAGDRYADSLDQSAGLRDTVRALLAEFRPLRAAGIDAPTLCSELRKRISAMLGDLESLRSERVQLLDDYGTDATFRESAGLA